MPGFWLKRQILMNLPSEDLEVSVANSIDFMVERVSRKLIASYLYSWLAIDDFRSFLFVSWTL